jgi:UDP-2,3-diacylglucosamine pyrophosphatase LpxH
MDDSPALRFRSIFVSDVHLGTPGCRADLLLEFLRLTDSAHLYLVGDIVDGWQLRRRWYWHQSHNDVVQKVLRKARKGTRVVYIRDEAVHVTADGRRLLVVHGDLFDAVVQRARWLAHLGDWLYNVILKLNQWFNHLTARLGIAYWSLSQFLKHRVKNAVSYMTDFEEALAHEARRRGFDGVVCGHIHKAEIRDIGGILYCNDGDWVESLTALVELESGELRIVDWRAIEEARARAVAATREVELAPAPGD